VTLAPARDTAAAIARPMPRPPPVTSAWEAGNNPDMRWFPEMALKPGLCLF
jgi:hypothetical protein